MAHSQKMDLRPELAQMKMQCSSGPPLTLAWLHQTAQCDNKSGYVIAYAPLVRTVGHGILGNGKSWAWPLVKGQYSLCVFGLGQTSPQPVQGDYGAARIIYSKDPLASNAGVEIRLRPKGSGFIQRFYCEVVARFFSGEGWSLTRAA